MKLLNYDKRLRKIKRVFYSCIFVYW